VIRQSVLRNFLYIFLFAVVSATLLASPQEVQAAGVALRPPFDGVYRMTAAFDHRYPNYTRDGSITIYTGETAPDPYRCDPTTGTYCYDGHNGYDWGMPNGTPILAAADGTVVHTRWWGHYGWQLIIYHGNGYYTMYGHLQGFNVNPGQNVRIGDLVAWSDNTGTSTGPHLHFTVYRGGYDSDDYATDPFGWRGSGADPLRDFGLRHTAECLWRGLPGDAISCFDHIVEDHYPDDGGGWSHGDWWDVVSGNLVWAHWTYTWATPTSWAQWDTRSGGYHPLLYHGFYQVYVFIPSTIGTRTRSAQYDIHYYPGSIETISVDQSAVSNNWRYLATREMEPDASYCYVYLDDYTGEPKNTRNVVADALKFSAEVTYLPQVHTSSTPGSWESYIEILNLSTSPAQVTVNWYRPDGSRYGYQNFSLPARGETSVSTSKGFDGAVVLVSDQDIAAVLRYQRDNKVAAYTGLSEANGGTGWGQPGVEVYAPVVMWLPWGSTWRTYLYIQNAGDGPATFDITYYDASGNPRPDCSLTNQTLPLRGSATYQQTACGAGFYGSARIVSTQPLAVVVLQQEDAHGASMYNAFSSGSPTVYLPSLMRSWYNWISSFTVQNLGTRATDVHIRYVRENGDVTERTYPNLLPGASVVIVQNDPNYGVPDVPGGWHGGARLTSTANPPQPLAAIVNQQRTDILNHQSYSAFLGGQGTLYGPFTANYYKSGSYCYVSASDIQNLSPTDATEVTRRYYDKDGKLRRTTTPTPIPPEGAVCFYLPAEGVAQGFYSLRATRNNAVPISGIHNIARLTLSGGVCGGETTGDYGASYNLVQRP